MLWAAPTTALLLFEREEKGRGFAEQSPASLSRRGFGSVRGGAMRCEAFLKTKSSLLGALRFGGGRFFVWDDGEGDGSGKRIHGYAVMRYTPSA